MKTYRLLLLVAVAAALLAACSTTTNIPEGDQLFTGLETTEYHTQEKSQHYTDIQEEIDAALATAPNGALFGSSSVRSPLQVGLWVWNAFAADSTAFGRWILKSFGSSPVLMSWVNPELRASVATEVLRAHGYFHGNVAYKVKTLSNPKKAKIAYTVNTGHLYTLDTVCYSGFPAEGDSLIQTTLADAKIKAGGAFDVSTLDAERTRLSTLFRNNGYFYWQPSYASYLADTVAVPGKVQLRLQAIEGVPEKAKRQWCVGNVGIDLRHSYLETLTDSVSRGHLSLRFAGRKPSLRLPVILQGMKLKPRQLYSYEDYQESLANITSTGLFSVVDFTFTPRDTLYNSASANNALSDNTYVSDTLDLRINAVLDKPYDFYVEGNVIGKTNNRIGPGIVVGFTKRNAFRGGELLDINLKGSYEWQTGHLTDHSSKKFNSYEYGIDASLTYPRLVIPFVDFFRSRLSRHFRRRRFYSVPTTTLKVSSDIISRANYFKRHIVSGEWTYSLQSSATSRHQFSPLVFSYEYMRSSTAAFDSVLNANAYLYYTMQDQFVPKMEYTYTYTSPSTCLNPIRWQTTVSEAGNLLSLCYMAAGKKWGQQGKEMFNNPYAQFVKIETDLVKTWQLGEHTTLVGHAALGAIWTYGNSSGAPYSEQFYVGGANSVRAFAVRSIGPGRYHNAASADIYYLDQTGDLKFQANLEYRPRLFGNLYGALFLDAGNVWMMHGDDRQCVKFEAKHALRDLALGTGVGLRYDMDFLVIRLDWGVGLHVPYSSGFYNVGRFKDSQSLHFAIGYPF